MSNTTDTVQVKYTAKDFASSADVRWCPGCGDYSILAQTQRSAPDFNIIKEKMVWVSGIGCSSRFPYYMDTYGFHGIHGRAPAIATGVKIANPDLSVWIAAGDGDLLSIGGNHFLHACRKNVDVKILLFNNKIYGLTKGQYSPTSEKGKKTKSTPYGSIDWPFYPINIAISSGATFVARSIDREAKHLQFVLQKAAEHKGLALIEIYQNCNIFNDGAFDHLVDKETKADNVLILEDGKPLVFGKNNSKGIILDGFTPRIVDLTDGSVSINDLWVHKVESPDKVHAYILSQFTEMEGFPTPIGIFYKTQKSTYAADIEKQIEQITAQKGKGDLKKLFYSGNTWTIE